MSKVLYLSTDVEANGPIPVKNSLLSIGSAAFTIEKEMVSTFSRNLEEFPGSSADESTAEFWSAHPEAWEANRRDAAPPAEVMADYRSWVEGLKSIHDAEVVFMAHPGAYDFMWVHWYMVWYTGDDPLGFDALCMKSHAAGLMGRPFNTCGLKGLAKRKGKKLANVHIALPDAIEQGEFQMDYIRDSFGLPPIEGYVDRTSDFA